jgi:hypothetical protein
MESQATYLLTIAMAFLTALVAFAMILLTFKSGRGLERFLTHLAAIIRAIFDRLL